MQVYFSAGDDGLYCSTPPAEGKSGIARRRTEVAHRYPVIVHEGKLRRERVQHVRRLLPRCQDRQGSLEDRDAAALVRFAVIVGKQSSSFRHRALTTDLSTSRTGQAAGDEARRMVLSLDRLTGKKREYNCRARYTQSAPMWERLLRFPNFKLTHSPRHARMIWDIDLGTPMVSGPTIATFCAAATPPRLHLHEDGASTAHPKDGKIYWTRSSRTTAARPSDVQSTWLPASTDSGVRTCTFPSPEETEQRGRTVR